MSSDGFQRNGFRGWTQAKHERKPNARHLFGAVRSIENFSTYGFSLSRNLWTGRTRITASKEEVKADCATADKGN